VKLFKATMRLVDADGDGDGVKLSYYVQLSMDRYLMCHRP
jgi:hypothetical protein